MSNPYIICELSGNHNGELDRALALVDAAAKTGADAVKLQTYTADTITIRSDRPEFLIKGGPWDGKHLHDLYHEASTPWDWHEAIFQRAEEHGLDCFSSPFDHTAVDFLERFDPPKYKIASFEMNDTPLIKKAASTGKPLIMSTGVASLGEIEEAVRAAREGGASDITLLHCISAYPAPAKEMRLANIQMLKQTFGVRVGLSDHSLGWTVPVAAVALGAEVIEKHMTLARADGGVDSGFSLEPDEFTAMVRECRMAAKAIGTPTHDRQGIGGANATFRRSLYIVEDVKAGEVFTAANVRSIRPGLGLAPKHYEAVLGQRASRDLIFGEPLDWTMVA